MIDYDALDRTKGYFELLHAIKLMDEEQMISELNEKLLNELITIFSHDKYFENFRSEMIVLINLEDPSSDGWVTLPPAMVDARSAKKIIYEQYLIPIGTKLVEVFNNSAVFSRLSGMRQIAIICLLLERDRMFSNYIDENTNQPINLAVIPSITDTEEMISSKFN